MFEWSAARWCYCGDTMSSFSDSIVFAVHTRKTAFSKSTVFKSYHSGERFRIDPFTLIVLGVVVWTIAVFGTKQYGFR